MKLTTKQIDHLMSWYECLANANPDSIDPEDKELYELLKKQGQSISVETYPTSEDIKNMLIYEAPTPVCTVVDHYTAVLLDLEKVKAERDRMITVKLIR
ncbi:hypothetical protein [Cohnella yongneupensis]|uniref:Uncharacterized protein n=1 Tax=Cohnella yongneupensis TaxID=425006 RepID=A0ABW0R5Y0_9BACL